MTRRLHSILAAASGRPLVKLGVVAVALLATCALAVAYVTSTGSGSSTGSTSIALTNLTITGGTATQSLFPTGTPTGDVNVTLNNPNSGPVHINSLLLDTSHGTNGFSANASSCALSFASQSNGGNGWTIPANGSLAVDLTGSVTMGTSAASSCQGQTFTVYLTAT